MTTPPNNSHEVMRVYVDASTLLSTYCTQRKVARCQTVHIGALHETSCPWRAATHHAITRHSDRAVGEQAVVCYFILTTHKELLQGGCVGVKFPQRKTLRNALTFISKRSKL